MIQGAGVQHPLAGLLLRLLAKGGVHLLLKEVYHPLCSTSLADDMLPLSENGRFSLLQNTRASSTGVLPTSTLAPVVSSPAKTHITARDLLNAAEHDLSEQEKRLLLLGRKQLLLLIRFGLFALTLTGPMPQFATAMAVVAPAR
jgi:hypothetical protein